MRVFGAALLAATLAACGGGGGSAGGTKDTPAGGTPPVQSPAATATQFNYTLSKAQLNNSGLDSVELTVTALDANNNPVEGVAVSVSVSSGVYTPKTKTTEPNGQTTGAITIGADKSNRAITVTIVVAGQTSTASIPVIGAAISLSPVPAAPLPGQPMRVDIKVTDFNGTGIAGVTVQLSGTLGLTGSTVATDATGATSATLSAAPVTSGTYTIDASALGVQATRSVAVGGGSIPAAVGPISSASIAVVPNTISPNTIGSTTKKAAIKANFLNASNQAIPNVRVRFEIVPPGLGSGEDISTGAGTVFSDASGNALADYIAGTRSSPTDGVTIRACYGLTDADIAGGACPINPATGQPGVKATLTVASQPLSITLGDNNLMEKGNGDLTYIKKFDVAVADSAGNAVANATISASVDITHYGKGNFDAFYPTGLNPPDINTVVDPTVVPGAQRVWCANEDTNRNGALDTGPPEEDINHNGKIDPRKADVILSFLGSNVTGPTGRMMIQVEFPQNVASWLAYTVRVTTNVAGSEGTAAKSYMTWFLEGDDANGAFWTPPYGVNACNQAN
jgi:protocatechuate 3,4-dioxygenase beta subunit